MYAFEVCNVCIEEPQVYFVYPNIIILRDYKYSYIHLCQCIFNNHNFNFKIYFSGVNENNGATENKFQTNNLPIKIPP